MTKSTSLNASSYIESLKILTSQTFLQQQSQISSLRIVSSCILETTSNNLNSISTSSPKSEPEQIEEQRAWAIFPQAPVMHSLIFRIIIINNLLDSMSEILILQLVKFFNIYQMSSQNKSTELKNNTSIIIESDPFTDKLKNIKMTLTSYIPENKQNQINDMLDELQHLYSGSEDKKIKMDRDRTSVLQNQSKKDSTCKKMLEPIKGKNIENDIKLVGESNKNQLLKQEDVKKESKEMYVKFYPTKKNDKGSNDLKKVVKNNSPKKY